MATTFKTPKNNAQSLVATAPSPATTGTSLVVTTGEGTLFPASNFWATIWNAATYSEPKLDPNFEVVLVSSRSTDTFTVTRGQLNGSAGRTIVAGDAVKLLLEDQHLIDIHTAVNALEAVPVPKSLCDATVGDSGADYTTIPLAITAGARTIGVKGTLTIAVSTTISTANVTIVAVPNTGGTIVMNNTSNRLTASASGIRFIGVTFDVNSTSNLASDTTAWLTCSGAYSYIEDCTFALDGMTTATTGVVVYQSSNNSVFRNNLVTGASDMFSVLLLGGSTSQLVQGNEFVLLSNTRCVYSDGSAGGKIRIMGNRFSMSAMTAAYFMVHVEDTTNTPDIHIIDNMFVPSGTYSAFSRDCVYVRGNGSSSYFGQGTIIVSGNHTSAAQNSQFGMYLYNVSAANIENNSMGTLTLQGTGTFNVTGNQFYSASFFNTITYSSIIVGNMFRLGANFYSLRNCMVSSNTCDPGNGTLTLDSSSYGCIVNNNYGWNLTVAGTYHTITNNVGYQTSSAEVSGTLTVSGSNHIQAGNRFATFTDTSTVPLAYKRNSPVLAKTAAYTATQFDEVITGDATSAAFTVTLPTAVGFNGRRFTIKKKDSTANAVTVGTTSSQTIDGATTYALSTQYQTITVVSDNANWLII